MVRVLLEIEREKYLRCVVPSEVPASWHEEMLKAQAVAARTYTLYKENYPEGTEYDLLGDSRSQNFNCELTHSRTDKAIRATAGEYLPGIMGEYVNKCGRVCCPYCKGANGHNNKSWDTRMCQEGGRVLAEQGLNYVEILQYYYGPEAIISKEMS